jgi:hypothetical protein
MARMEDMHVRITWDTEPTDGAKALIQLEVRKVLQETFQESSWLTELVRAEVRKALSEGKE